MASATSWWPVRLSFLSRPLGGSSAIFDPHSFFHGFWLVQIWEAQLGNYIYIDIHMYMCMQVCIYACAFAYIYKLDMASVRLDGRAWPGLARLGWVCLGQAWRLFPHGFRIASAWLVGGHFASDATLWRGCDLLLFHWSCA